MKRIIKSNLVKVALAVLRDPSVERRLWEIVHRPNPEVLRQIAPANPWLQLWESAAEQTASYIEKNMLQVTHFGTRNDLFDEALRRVEVDGLYLEFGSAYGRSTNYLAERIQGTLHGFDSFEGLPTDWFGDVVKGTFTRNGQLPNVRNNVELHVGWFDESLPAFLQSHSGKVAFVHIDCDLYASTKTVFDCLENRIGAGTVIVFGEYFNYPGWQHHEYRAFQEFIEERGYLYEYLGYTSRFHAAIVVKSAGKGALPASATEITLANA